MSLMGRRRPRPEQGIPPYVWRFLTTGGVPGEHEAGHDEIFGALFVESEARELRERWGTAALARWKREHPGRRPPKNLAAEEGGADAANP